MVQALGWQDSAYIAAVPVLQLKLHSPVSLNEFLSQWANGLDSIKVKQNSLPAADKFMKEYAFTMFYIILMDNLSTPCYMPFHNASQNLIYLEEFAGKYK